MAKPFQPTYQKTLRKVRDALGMARVLSPFWRRRQKWPSGDKEFIFVGEAIDHVGRTKFGDSWTGNEFAAYWKVYDFHSFPQTLVDFRDEYEGWYSNEYGRVDQNQVRGPSSQVASHETGAPVNAPTARAALRTDIDQSSGRHVQDLERWGAHYRREFDDAVAAWTNFAADNAKALKRLTWAVDWLVTKARDGEVETYLRRVDTSARPGPYRPAPDGFWNVENEIRNRLFEGSLTYTAQSEVVSESAGEDQRAYIFFNRVSFDRSLLTMGQVAAISPQLDGVYLSAYMLLAIAAIREEGLTPSYQSKKDSVENTVRCLAPQFGIDPDSAKTLIGYIASIVREPDSQKGRQKKMGLTQRNS